MTSPVAHSFPLQVAHLPFPFQQPYKTMLVDQGEGIRGLLERTRWWRVVAMRMRVVVELIIGGMMMIVLVVIEMRMIVVVIVLVVSIVHNIPPPQHET